MSRIALVLNRDFASFPSEMPQAVTDAGAFAATHLKPGAIGAAYRDPDIRRLTLLLPASHGGIYRMLFPNGRTRPVPHPDTHFHWDSVQLKDPEWRTGAHALHYRLRWIKELLVDETAIYHHAMAHAFILRPKSLIVLYAPAEGQNSGTILMPEATSGHDALEELTAIMADFPDRFEIEAQ